MIKDMAKIGIDKLNDHRIGVGTGLLFVAGLMWLSYEAGTRGWEAANVHFVDHAEAAEYVTWTQMEVRDKNKNIRILKGQIRDDKIKIVETEARTDIEAESKVKIITQIKVGILEKERNIELEKEAIDCIKAGDKTCDF
jgi:hypothetical protein